MTSCLKLWVPMGLLVGLLTGLTGSASAQDRAQIDPTVILGNRELPKVLYIVPWKKPAPAELAGRPLTSVVDEALAPIDRDVFRREVQYQSQARAYASAQAARQAQTAKAAQDGSPEAPATEAPPGAGAAPVATPASAARSP